TSERPEPEPPFLSHPGGYAMRRRLSARAIKLVTEGAGDVAVCFCGAQAWAHDFRRWPMRHVSRCLACGAQTVTELKPSPPRKPPPNPQPPDYGYGPYY